MSLDSFDELVGVRFADYNSRVIRETGPIIVDDKICSSIVEVMPGSVYEDKDSDDACMIPIWYIQKIIDARKSLFRRLVCSSGYDIKSGKEL